MVLVFFALVTGMTVMLTLHTGQLARADHLRTLDIELRQMIDSGAAYARAHRDDWPAGEAPVVLDAADLIGPQRSGSVTLQPTFGPSGPVEAVTIIARLELPRNKTRTMTTHLTIGAD